jgi:hypothetical protein
VGAVIMAIALVFFTNTQKAKAVTLLPDYYWFYDEAATDYTWIDNTVPYMVDTTGCTGGTVYPCVYGYLASDFNEFGVHESGLKPDHGSPYIIYEHP